MTDSAVTGIVLQMMLAGAKLCAPMLITALVIGFAVSLLQAATSLQDQTLSAVPKMIGVAVALLVCGNWMLSTLVSFTQEMFALVPQLVSG
jgi:flagellar biosynthetic protein FliQ